MGDGSVRQGPISRYGPTRRWRRPCVLLFCLKLCERGRHQIAGALMRAHLAEVTQPRLNDGLRFSPRAEPIQRQASLADLPIETLRGAILPRLMPGPINAHAILCDTIHSSSARDTNSGPLSERRVKGATRSNISRDTTSITRADRMRPSSTGRFPPRAASGAARHWPRTRRSACATYRSLPTLTPCFSATAATGPR